MRTDIKAQFESIVPKADRKLFFEGEAVHDSKSLDDIYADFLEKHFANGESYLFIGDQAVADDVDMAIDRHQFKRAVEILNDSQIGIDDALDACAEQDIEGLSQSDIDSYRKKTEAAEK